MSTCLDENCEDDDDNSGCDEKFLAANVFWKGENQGKGNCSSQATVGQTKLVFQVEGDGAERVNNLSQDQHA